MVDQVWRLDMHVHSFYSTDSMNSIHAIVRNWEQTHILPIVCDHDSVRGSVEVYAAIREKDPDIPLIMAEEIATAEGEIIGVFLNEEIPSGIPVEETLDEIRSQGAISIVPHPFCRYRSSAISFGALERVIDDLDCVEGYNARILQMDQNNEAVDYAKMHKKPISVGSDAHTPWELGINHIGIEPFDSPSELLGNLGSSTVTFKITNPGIHYVTKIVKAIKVLDSGFCL